MGTNYLPIKLNPKYLNAKIMVFHLYPQRWNYFRFLFQLSSH